MADSAPRLPARPSLEQLRKQAKDLLRDVRHGRDEAVHRVRIVLPRAGEPSIAKAFTLADAQFVLAREHGFESWADLVHHVEALRPAGIAKYERLAERVAQAYTMADAGVIRDVNAENSTSFIWDREA